MAKWRKIEKECWNFFAEKVAEIQPIAVLLWMGDSIDGRGERSGSTELVVVDRSLQVAMAQEVIETFEAKHIVMVYGTPYHTGNEEDWEDQLAHQVHADKIGSHEWVDVNGCIFDIKHHVGASSIPHGRHTALSREQLWNALWADAKSQPRADFVIRGHVHYAVGDYCYVGSRQRWALTTPALQGVGTKFGSRKCSGTVDFGITYFDVYEDGSCSCPLNLVATLPSHRARVVKF